MNKKAIFLHIDIGENKFYAEVSQVLLVNTLFQIHGLKNVDIIIHSVNNGANFIKGNLNQENILIVEDEFAKLKSDRVYLTRIYGLFHPIIQSYDEIIILDSDFKINDIKKVQEFIDLPIAQDVGAIAHIQKKHDIEYLWGAYVKVNMQLFREKISEEEITKHYKNYCTIKIWDIPYDEYSISKTMQTLNIPYENLPDDQYRNLKHYWYSPSLHRKLECAIDTITNNGFQDWLIKNGLQNCYQNCIKQCLATWLNKYIDLYNDSSSSKEYGE